MYTFLKKFEYGDFFFFSHIFPQKFEYGEDFFFSCNLFKKGKLSYILD